MKSYWLEKPGQPAIDGAELAAQGLVNAQCEPDNAHVQPLLDDLMTNRGYGTQDEVALDPDTPNLDALLDKFRPEHHHTEDEVRFVLSGEGIFDVRSLDDQWMRIEVGPGDMLIVPAMRHHRYFLKESRAIRCVRLFQDPNGWTAHYRDDTSAQGSAATNR